MGVDLTGIIGHNLTMKDVIGLPSIINSWPELNEFASKNKNRIIGKAEWDGFMNEEQLELIWRYYEEKRFPRRLRAKMKNSECVITCTFGRLSVNRRTICLTNWNHKYWTLRYPDEAKNILELNRLVAKKLGQNEILYCPDSSFPTSIIEDHAFSGKSYYELKELGIKHFGIPPKNIEDGRKYMFFFDDMSKDLDSLTEWEGEESYWQYDKKKDEYHLRSVYESESAIVKPSWFKTLMKLRGKR
jgi:hypothetical protein